MERVRTLRSQELVQRRRLGIVNDQNCEAFHEMQTRPKLKADLRDGVYKLEGCPGPIVATVATTGRLIVLTAQISSVTPHPPIPQYPSGFFARYCW